MPRVKPQAKPQSISKLHNIEAKHVLPRNIHKLIPCSRLVLKMLTAASLLQRRTTFYQTRTFISLVTTVHHWFLPWATLIQTALYDISKKKKSKGTGRTAQRGSRGIALPFHDHGTRRGWGVSVRPRSLFTPRKDPVPIVQEAGGVPRPVWTGAGNLAQTGIRYPDCPARIKSLYRQRYRAHTHTHIYIYIYIYIYTRT
jgi:hypothetical protein